jgi:hypothetical protein
VDRVYVIEVIGPNCVELITYFGPQAAHVKYLGLVHEHRDEEDVDVRFAVMSDGEHIIFAKP